MKAPHEGMGVKEGDFSALVEDLVAALDRLKVREKEKGGLLGLLGPMKNAIVWVCGGGGGATRKSP